MPYLKSQPFVDGNITGIALRGHKMSTNDAPTQVRVRTDPAEGLEHRYRQIVRAKEVLGRGNNTDAVVAACEHAVRDVEAKREAMDILSNKVGDDLLKEIAETLSTTHVPVTVDRSIVVGGSK